VLDKRADNARFVERRRGACRSVEGQHQSLAFGHASRRLDNDCNHRVALLAPVFQALVAVQNLEHLALPGLDTRRHPQRKLGANIGTLVYGSRTQKRKACTQRFDGYESHVTGNVFACRLCDGSHITASFDTIAKCVAVARWDIAA
jgi:hypothetical protein